MDVHEIHRVSSAIVRLKSELGEIGNKRKQLDADESIRRGDLFKLEKELAEITKEGR